jgi:triosephosphate isomerase
MKKTIVGNWKMNGNMPMASALVHEISSVAAALRSEHEIIVCPPFTLLSEVAKALAGGFIQLGAQDCSAHSEGAFTGEISASMLVEQGCRYVIVGHSERRAYHGETSVLVKSKAEAALAAGLIPIICVGETRDEREAGRAEAVVSEQLRESLPLIHDSRLTIHDFLLAYEPVWAIGSGKIPSISDIEAMHAHILRLYPKANVLYGGSVKAANAAEIMALPGVSGVLVGGASLKAEEFLGIIKMTR